MSANRNNDFAAYLRYLPSKTLSFDHIRSEDKVFFEALGAEGVMARLDAATAACRDAILSGRYAPGAICREFLLGEIYSLLREAFEREKAGSSTLTRVINATGVVIHTNLGRAPLPAPGESLQAVSAGYSNLEFDLSGGGRGKRDAHVSGLLAKLTGAADAIVVNNNAAAVLLVARALSNRREAIIARGESVEVGEGFRITEMLRQGGAKIVDVGATNSVTAADYRDAASERTGLIVKVHPSNFSVTGFVRSADPAEVAGVARSLGVASYFDAGSGLVSAGYFKGSRVVRDEPEVRSLVAAGFDLVSFSGDKLFGSVQCGIICGRAEIIAKLRRCQLYRALRVSKAVVASLQDAAREYLSGDPARNIPAVRMLAESAETIGARCAAFLAELSKSPVFAEAKKRFAFGTVSGRAMAGGGTTPGAFLENPVVKITPLKTAPRGPALESLSAALRSAGPPVVGYVDSDALFLNFRTVSDGEVASAASSLISALERTASRG